MTPQTFSPKFDRRTLIKGAAALGAFQVASPFIIQARGEAAVRIGMVDHVMLGPSSRRRITPEPVIGPRVARTRWAKTRPTHCSRLFI